MRISALIGLAILLPHAASSQEWCSSPICARFEGTDLIRIRAPGRFELTFTKREGFGEELYDLKADPGELHDLSSSLQENGILWSVVQELGDPVTYFANNATSLQLLEASGVRVQARDLGLHHLYGLPDMPWNDLGYVQTFTVYATGEVYVDYTLVASRDIPLGSFTLIVKTTGAWGPNATGDGAGEAQCISQYGSDKPYDPFESSFAMASSNGTHFFADVLMATYTGVHNGSYWNEGFEDADYRCGLWRDDYLPTLVTGATHVPLMLRIAEDMNDATAGAKHANAYRSPDLAFHVTQGTKVLDDPGDLDGDGFNETEGTYAVRRQTGQDVEFELHAGIPRQNPAFKILDWNGPVPQSVSIDGTFRATGGSEVRASLSGSTLLVQLLGERNTTTQVLVTSQAPQVPALPGLAGAALALSLGVLGAAATRRRRVSSCRPAA
jgi:hypothetical protein